MRQNCQSEIMDNESVDELDENSANEYGRIRIHEL